MKSSALLALVCGSLVGCGVAAQSPDAPDESALASSHGALVRGCVTFGPLGETPPSDNVLCLEQAGGREHVTLRRSGQVALDRAPATRTARRVTAEQIESFEASTWSQNWDEIAYRTGDETVTFLIGADHGRHWPIVVRAFGDVFEAWPQIVPYSDTLGLAGCADVATDRPFGAPREGTLCTTNVSGDSAVVSLRIGTETVLESEPMARSAVVGPPEASCIDPHYMAHVCRPVTAKRTVEYRSSSQSLTVTSYISEWGFDVDLSVGAEQHFVLRPSFTP